MRAVRLLSWKSEPVLVEVPEPTPGPGQVVVRIGGAGACHSDLHLMHDFEPGRCRGHRRSRSATRTPAGSTRSATASTGLEVGQPVAVYGPWGCGRCARCRLGVETYCEDPPRAPVPGGGGGLGARRRHGRATCWCPTPGYLVPLPDGLDPRAAAPLTDAGLTPYHAVRRSLAEAAARRAPRW